METRRGDGHVKTEAEMGVVQPQTEGMFPRACSPAKPAIEWDPGPSGNTSQVFYILTSGTLYSLQSTSPSMIYLVPGGRHFLIHQIVIKPLLLTVDVRME